MIKLVARERKPQKIYESGTNDMGLVYADIELLNAGEVYLLRKKEIEENDVKQIKVRSLVNTGAHMLTITDDVKNQLDLPLIEKQFATLADETQIEGEILRPVEIRFENRRTTCDAVVRSSARDVLLGSIPMKDMDVLIHPKEEKLVVNPKHPYVANKYLK